MSTGKKNGVSDKGLIAEVVQVLGANERVRHSYLCSNCGFKAYRLYWRCPSCHRWGVAQPRDVVAPASGSEAEVPKTPLPEA